MELCICVYSVRVVCYVDLLVAIDGPVAAKLSDVSGKQWRLGYWS